MELKQDSVTYNSLQQAFVDELIARVKIKLMESGLEGEALLQLTADIAFSVASLIDDQSPFEHEGMEVHPYLTFMTTEDQLTHHEDNSFMHEYVYEALK